MNKKDKARLVEAIEQAKAVTLAKDGMKIGSAEIELSKYTSISQKFFSELRELVRLKLESKNIEMHSFDVKFSESTVFSCFDLEVTWLYIEKYHGKKHKKPRKRKGRS